ncbi:glycosyltransferase involved in cell wall biosynthesis [Pedobacter sp. CG_S7]|uniref:glycosyltransferase n=1 Tax=Pedobacter sp. CG_S7 TaxID=3143930 RepID=UPI0033915449
MLIKKRIENITIIGEFRFPLGDAASVRVLGIGRMLRSCGYNISFIGKNWERDNDDFKGGIYDGFRYHNMAVKNQRFIKRFCELLYSGIIVKEILKAKHPNCDLIIYYGSSARFLYPLLKFSKERKIKLIVDLVEWYDPSHLIGGRFGPIAVDVKLGLTYLIPKCDGLIAISSLLEKHYIDRKMRAIRIPQIVDIQESKWNPTSYESFDKKSLNIVYAGIPGRKDLISIAILGLDYLTKNGYNVKLHLFGPSKSDIYRLMKNHKANFDNFQDNLIYHGRVNQDDLPKYLVKGDYSILLRPNKRYANAGFATKFVESFAVGLPVIANLTSDMGFYLKDSKNGFVVEECTVESFVNTIKRAFRLTEREKNKMRIEAKNTGTEFDYRNYTPIIKDFINKIENL